MLDGVNSKYVWHPRFHQEVGETLRYIFIRFEKSVDESSVFAEFQKIFELHQITSYGVYEVYGDFDFIIKIWLPADPGSRTYFLEAFRGFLGSNQFGDTEIRINDRIKAADFLECKWHWLWESEVAVPLELDDKDALSILCDRYAENPEDKDTIEELSQRGLIRTRNPDPDGIRFFVLVTCGNWGASFARAQEVELLRAVSETVGIKNAEVYISEYLRPGDWVFIDARVDLEDYGSIYQLLRKIRNLEIRWQDSTTTTFLCVDSNRGVLEAAKPKISSDSVELPIEKLVSDLLQSEEGLQFEAKGSYRFDLKRFIATGEKSTNSKVEEKVLQGIVAFMNSDGGTLIIGATEPQDYPKEKISEYVHFGRFALVGYKNDVSEKLKNFDGFERAIKHEVRQRVSATASKVIAIEEVTIEGVELIAIKVPKLGADLVSLDGDIIVRDGGSSIKLSGKEAIAYSQNRKNSADQLKS